MALEEARAAAFPAALPQALAARLADYWILTKPGITFAVLFTTLAGYLLASGTLRWPLLAATLLGTGLASSGGAALNMLMEADSDGLMERTKGRPLPAGRLNMEEAFFFGILSGAAGIFFLAVCVNPLAGFLSALTLLFYLVFYTPMKVKSPFCTLFGAVSGALPPLIGWSAARGTLSPDAWLFFALLFLWQFPHLLALGWIYREDYARAGIRILPVSDAGGRRTAAAAFALALPLLPLSLQIAAAAGGAGWVLAAAASLALFLTGAASLFLIAPSLRSARALFLVSVLYIPLLCLSLIAIKF